MKAFVSMQDIYDHIFSIVWFLTRLLPSRFMFYHSLRCAEPTLTPGVDLKAPQDKRPKPKPKPKPDTSYGWDRFRHVPINVDPSKNGRLLWVEAKTGTTPQAQTMSAIVWSPNFTSDQPAASIDMIFYYCPSTDKQVAAYPYGLVMVKDDGQKESEARPDQSYMSVGSRYMQKEHGIIYTLIARRSNAIIIMPLNKKGAWDPFTAQEGVWRFCQEIALLLHRECRTSSLGAKASGSNTQRDRCGGSLRDIRASSPEATTFGQPPTIRKLAIAFFSAGAYGAKSCMDFWSLESSLAVKGGAASRQIGEIVSDGALQRFSAKLWGCENSMALRDSRRKDAFTNAWTEIWDIDGFHASGWGPYLVQLKKWFTGSQQKRIIRLCHSDGRRPRRPLGSKGDSDDAKKDGLWKLLLGENLEKITSSSVDKGEDNVPIQEIYGDRFSVVALDAMYLNAGKENPPDQFPQLLMGKDPAHHATFKVGWSHCIAISDVGRTP